MHSCTRVVIKQWWGRVRRSLAKGSKGPSFSSSTTASQRSPLPQRKRTVPSQPPAPALAQVLRHLTLSTHSVITLFQNLLITILSLQHILSTHHINILPQYLFSTHSQHLLSTSPIETLNPSYLPPPLLPPASANTPSSTDLSSGMYFCEMTLIDDDINRSTVVTTTESEFFTLTRAQFDVVMTQVQGGKYENSGKLFVTENEVLEPLTEYRFNDLETIAMLGSGTFGRVNLVRERSTKNIYALKTMLKTEIVAHKQQNNVLNERYVFQSLRTGPIPSYTSLTHMSLYDYFSLIPLIRTGTS